MRLHDWPRRLNRVLADAAARPFEWGVHDCFTHAGRVAWALTGVDPSEPLHGLYRDYPTGLAVARNVLGVVGLRGFGDRSWNRVPRALAWRGDWALARPAMVQGWALLMVDNGVLRDAGGAVIPLAEARVCWRVA